MEGIPHDLIAERIMQKTQQQIKKLESDLKKMDIMIEHPSFDIRQFEVPNPRPPKPMVAPVMGGAMRPP